MTNARETREFLQQRKTAYLLTFEQEQPANQAVLDDLAFFCRANESTIALDKQGRVDTENSLRLQGRREVWLRIQYHLGLTSEQLLLLYARRLQ